MSEFRIVDELPKAPAPAVEQSGRESTTKLLVRFLIQNPNQWVEVLRRPVKSGTNAPNAHCHVMARRLRSWGLHCEVRRDGDEYVLFARLVPGSAQ